MAEFVFASVADKFPVGSTVEVFKPSGNLEAPNFAGQPVATAVVAPNGSLAFPNLDANTAYIAYEPTTRAWKTFRTPPPLESSGGSTTIIEQQTLFDVQAPRTQDFSFAQDDDFTTIPTNGGLRVIGTIGFDNDLQDDWRCQVVVQGDGGFELNVEQGEQVEPAAARVFQKGDSFTLLRRRGARVTDILDLPTSGTARTAAANVMSAANTFQSVLTHSGPPGTLRLFGYVLYWGTMSAPADIQAAFPNAETEANARFPDGYLGILYVRFGPGAPQTIAAWGDLPAGGGPPPTDPTFSVTPLLEGSAVRGNQLAVYMGTIAGDLDHVAWQWQRETSPGVWAAIPAEAGTAAYVDGALLDIYTTQAADDNLKVRARVDAIGESGAVVTTYAQTTGAVAYIPVTPPAVVQDVEKFVGHTATSSANKPARTTDPIESYTPDLALDGLLTTRWSTPFGVDGDWWQVDMGAPKLIKRVELTWYENFAKTYKIQTSLDNATFTDRVTENISAPGLKVSTFPEVTARCVRVVCVSRQNAQYGSSFWEARGYGSPDLTGPNDTAFNVERPQITGTAQSGEVLTCGDGVWQYPNGALETVGPFTRQWTANGTDIPGATGKTWTATDAYVGQTIGCKVTFDGVTVTATGGSVLQAQPSQTNVAPTFSQQPSIPASALVGSAVQVNVGQAVGTPTPALAIQWQQFTAGAWANIGGATATTYTPTTTNQLRVVVTASNGVLPNAVGTSNTVTPTGTGATRSSFAYPFAPDYPATPFSPFNTIFTDLATFEGVGTGKTATWFNTGTNVNSNNGYGMRLDQARLSDPLVPIYDANNNNAYLHSIRAPSAAIPLAGSDGNLNIVEPNGYYADTYWRMQSWNGSQGPGYRTYRWVRNYIRDNPQGQRYDGIGGGIRAAGFATPAGIFRWHHVQDGYCPSACVVAAGRALMNPTTRFVWPANTSDGYSYDGSGSVGLSLGDRFGIPYGTANPGGLGPAGLVLFEMARTAGFYIGDTLGTKGSTGIIMVAEPALELNLGASAFSKFQTDFRTIKNLSRRLTNGGQSAPGGPLGVARTAQGHPAGAFA